MRKKVRIIILLLLIILLLVAIFAGIRIGSFHILSISQLKDRNNSLETKIQEASKLTSIDYPTTVQTLENSYEKQTIQKQKYEELVGLTEEKQKSIYETKQYDIGYLWRTVGKYATTYNISISMDVKKASGNNLYDLYFNVTGSYVNISEFIADIENDSNLYFRIYNFKMTGSSETVSASFNVKDVNIDPSTIKGNVSTPEDED